MVRQQARQGKQPLERKDWYEVAEIARASGRESRVVVRVLRAQGVPLARRSSGPKARYIVTLDDLRQYWPSFFDSLVLVEVLRAGELSPEQEIVRDC